MIERDMTGIVWRTRDLPEELRGALPRDTHRLARGIYNAMIVAGVDDPTDITIERVRALTR